MKVIETHGLTKQYGMLKAVKGVDFAVEKGSICGLVGRNGAGKTTLIRMLVGLVKPTEGSFEIHVDGERKDTSVSAIVEAPSFYGGLSAKNNLAIQMRLLGLDDDQAYLDDTLRLVGLLPESVTPVKNFSLGMRQRLAIAMAIVGKPQLLILDEPTNGLDPQGIHDVRQLLAKLNAQGTTILISSHILSELGKLATHYCFMEKGEIISSISAEEIEKLCKGHIAVTVNKVMESLAVLTENGYEAKSRGNVVTVYDEDAKTGDVVTLLAKNGVDVLSANKEGGNLEDYYINLIGGANKHD